MNLKLWVGPPLPWSHPSLGLACAVIACVDRVSAVWTFGAGVRHQLMLHSRSLVGSLLTSAVVAAAIALAECTPGGTASTGNSGSIGSFVSNLLGSKTEDQVPLAQNAAPIEAFASKTKPATSKPKHPAVAGAGAHPGKLAEQPANTKTAIALVPNPSPKRQASAEPQSTSESTTTPLLSGAAPTLATGSFDNRFGSWR